MHEGQCPNLCSNKDGKAIAVLGEGPAYLGCERARMMLLLPTAISAALCGTLLNQVLCSHSGWSCSLAQR